MRAMLAWDVAVAVTLAAFMPAVAMVARTTQPQARPVTAVGVVLLVVCGLALSARRASPWLAYVLAVGAAVAYLGLRFAGWPVYVGAFAGLGVLVAGIPDARRWVPFATLGGVGIAVATGPPEGWQPVRMITIALVWAAVAVLVARGAQLRRRLAEEEATSRAAVERLRLARELHDVLSHSLASISLQAGVGLHLVDRQPGQAQHALRTIRQISTDALAQARTALAVVRGTRDESPAAPGLGDLEGLLASVRATGLSVDLDTDLDGSAVPETIGTTAYRVVQEALTNVMRHAGPGAHAHARVGRLGTWLQIDVTDDGAGAGAPADGAGHGLRGMTERVSAVGGQVRAGPAAGGGFALHARLPLKPKR